MRRLLTTVVALTTAMAMTLPAVAKSHTFPETIPLPDGFQPEGIATGSGSEFFVGSIPTGDIYKGDLRSGHGQVITDIEEPRAALGMKHDPRSDVLWVAGGPFGQGYVYDAESGETVAEIDLTSPGTFINDVVVTRNAAFFTDSFQPFIFKVPLDDRGLPNGPVEALSLGSEFVSVAASFNANGIDATPNGEILVLVNSVTGSIYTVDPDTGEATEIDLGGDSTVNGDGILLDGKTLYVVQNFNNQIAIVELAPDLSSGVVSGTLVSDEFMIPTTIGEFGDALYAVNARFDVAPPGSDPSGIEYDAVRVTKQ